MRGSDVNSFFEGAVPKPGHRSSHNDGTDGDFNARVMASNRHDGPPPFRLLGAAANPEANARSAVIVSCPHAGRYYPEDLVAAGSIGIEALRDLEDFAVDALLDDLRHTNIGGICSQIARAYIDVNRPEDALDQNMFDEPVTAAKQSRKVLAGYGLLPRVTSARTTIHDRLLSADAANQRIEFAYRPYHDKLQELLGNAKKATVIIFLLIVIRCQPLTSITDTYLISFSGIAMAGHWRPILANRLMILSGQKISRLAGMPPIQAAISPAITAKPPALANLCRLKLTGRFICVARTKLMPMARHVFPHFLHLC